MYGQDGRPLHSWRVLILPHVGHDQLYKEFRLDEPWDSEHNLRLLDRMPSDYVPPQKDKIPRYHTMLHVFVGPGTWFEERDGMRFPKGGFDAHEEEMLLFVEAGEPVPWTKPEEIVFDPTGPIRLRGLFRNGGFRGCLSGGRYRFFGPDTTEAELRAAISRYGRQ